MNLKRNTARHLVIKMIKIKERLLKETRVKQQITYKGIPIRLSADFFCRNSAGQKRVAPNIQSDEREKNLQTRIIYPARLSLRFDGEIKIFTASKS